MINKPYSLLTKIEILKCSNGKYYAPILWAKDLRLHLDYIKELNICCPASFVSAPPDKNKFEDITDIKQLSYTFIRKDHNRISALLNVFGHFFRILKLCSLNGIIHSSGAGWPFPLSFYVLVLRPFFRFKWVMVIESSFWMRYKGQDFRLRSVISEFFHRMLIKRCVRCSDVRIFTHSGYKNLFLNQEDNNFLIAPAIWLDPKFILNVEKVKENYLSRRKRLKGKVSYLYPARLVREKGVFVLLEAISTLDLHHSNVMIDIIGSGSEKDELISLINKRENHNIKISFLNEVPYGDQFFELLSDYDAVLVPNLNQEQPRIIFDAFSQGVPVIGSDVPGISDFVIHKENGYLFELGNPKSLARAIIEYANDDNQLKMAENTLQMVQNKSHKNMHKVRYDYFKRNGLHR